MFGKSNRPTADTAGIRPGSRFDRLPIERVVFDLSPNFVEQLVARGRPVLITGMTETWPARRWSLQQLKTDHGETLVTVGVTQQGVLQASKDRGIAQVELPLRAYIDQLEAGRPELYLLSPVEERLPALLGDLRPPPMHQRAGFHSTRLWLGPEGTVSPLHRDFPDNLYVQLIGRKRLLIVDPAHTQNLYPYAPWSHLPNFSQVDAEWPEDPRYPRFASVPCIECVVEPGEVVFLPALWWHHVRSLDTSLSVNLWFAKGWRARVARALVAYATLRGMRK